MLDMLSTRLDSVPNMKLPPLTNLTAQGGEKVEWGNAWGDVAEPVVMPAAEDEVMPATEDEVMPATEEEVYVPLGVVNGSSSVVGMLASTLEKVGVDDEQLKETMTEAWTSKTSERDGWGTKVFVMTKNAHLLLDYLQAQDAEWGLESVTWPGDHKEDVTAGGVDLSDLRVYKTPNDEGPGKPWYAVTFFRYNHSNSPVNQQEWFSDDDTTIEIPRDRITVYSEIGRPPDVALREQLLMPSMSH